MKNIVIILMIMKASIFSLSGQPTIYQSDTYETSAGKLVIHLIGHSSLMFEFKGMKIYTDPWSKVADYSKFPEATLILLTHQHPDHLDKTALKFITGTNTRIIGTKTVAGEVDKTEIMKNGDKISINGITIEAVAAYNTTAGRDIYHPKGRDNGYVITFGNLKVYVAGDTENIPEMASLKNIDIAFLPMNQPYTMLPKQVYDAALSFHPKVLYPYHYSEEDIPVLKSLMEKEKSIQLKIAKMK